MLFLTRCFGVTVSDAERNPVVEKADIEEIVEKVLLMQSQAPPTTRPLARNSHKGSQHRAHSKYLISPPGTTPSRRPLAKECSPSRRLSTIVRLQTRIRK